MEEQKVLLAIMLLHQSNMHILHWNAVGPEFDTMHVKVTDDYYSKIGEDLDGVCETIIRMGGTPCNYPEVLMILRDCEGCNYQVYSSEKTYTRDEIVAGCDEILGDICRQIVKVLKTPEIENDPKNIGIKSYYENLLNEYDKEYRFLNCKRK